MRCPLPLSLVAGIITSAILLMPAPGRAADVCCSCKAPNDTKTACLTFDAAELQNAADCTTLPQAANLPEGWTCEKDPLSETKCKLVADGGVCNVAPANARSKTQGEAVTKKEQQPSSPPLLPSLAINIPGFQPPDDPSAFFAAYVVAIYRYGISIAAIAATVVFIYGAFLYLLQVKGREDVMKGKTVMKDAVIGMLLVFSAALILRTLNPELLELKSLGITTIQTKAVEFINDDDYKQLTGKDKITKEKMKQLAIEKAEETGIEELPCIIEASLKHESGGAIDAIGHDENCQATNYSVSARQKFLQSGLYYSGSTFKAITCKDKSCQNQGPLNDDRFNVNQPPNYGLDWRYSHGFGPGQLTIFPKAHRNRPCEGREEQGFGYRIAGTCYTIPELLTPEVSATAMVATFRSAFARAGKDVAQTFVNYAGKVEGGKSNPAIQSRMKAYQNCRKREQAEPEE